jgi:hypothetical protein
MAFSGDFMDQAVAAGLLASNNGVKYDANGIALTDERGIALPDPYGNLGVLPAAEDGMETVDVYQMQSQVAPELAEGLRLQDVYGTAAMPMYEFVKPVKTGTRTFSTVPDFGGVTFDGEKDPFGTGNNTDFNTSNQKEIARRMQQAAAGELGSMVGGNIGRQYLFGGEGIADNFGKSASEGLKSSFSFKSKTPTFEGFSPKVGVGYGAGRFAGGLLAGEDFKDAAKAGVKSGVGAAVGSVFGPAGAFIGASLLGRVICNELQRQGVMSRQNVLLDYRFTRDYLTPQHVNGYHVWAVHVVKQMRKGRGVKLWRHLAQHRANEIAYIYGKRDKPDYLGKIYRKILEPICWSVGFFCEKTDWSVLYKAKET